MSTNTLVDIITTGVSRNIQFIMVCMWYFLSMKELIVKM